MRPCSWNYQHLTAFKFGPDRDRDGGVAHTAQRLIKSTSQERLTHSDIEVVVTDIWELQNTIRLCKFSFEQRSANDVPIVYLNELREGLGLELMQNK